MKLQALIEGAETYVTSIIRGRRESRWDTLMRAVLFVLSRVFRTLVLWRLQLYRHRIFHNHALGCQIISIGNLTTGGTGKTPVVEVFARHLAAAGRRVAILSRGYRSKPKPLHLRVLDSFGIESVESPPRVVWSPALDLHPSPDRLIDAPNIQQIKRFANTGTQPETDENCIYEDDRRVRVGGILNSNLAGDEPHMLARNLKQHGVVVLTDPDRVKSGRHAIREHDCDTLVLDDGFQYLPLRPHLNILLIDSTDPFNNHHLLPRGLLREPIRNIRRADLIFLTKSDGSPSLRHLKRFVKTHNHHAEIIECTHRPQYLQDAFGPGKQPLGLLAGKKVSTICGIAAPESFESFVRGFDSEIVHTARYADHHRYSRDEIEAFIHDSAAAGAELILTTEKDAVRLPRITDCPLPILFMRVEIDILSGQESFDEFIARICFSPRPSYVADRFDDDDDDHDNLGLSSATVFDATRDGF